MVSLALDCSTRTLHLAVCDDAGVIHEQVKEQRIEDGAPGQSERLAGAIEDFLTINSLTLNRVKRVVIGAGPGSFTGLRIGWSLVKGLCFANKAALIGVSSLRAISHELLSVAPVVAFIDAGSHGKVYAACYSSVGQELISEGFYDLAWLQEEVRKQSQRTATWVSPTSCDEISQLRTPIHVGSALLNLAEGIQANYSISELALAAPNYIQAVRIKSIKERELNEAVQKS